MGQDEYWFGEGAYAYKAGITLPDLGSHFPAGTMTEQEWQALQSGWVATHNEFLEDMGQGRLFQ